jgi:hypothetical protein
VNVKGIDVCKNGRMQKWERAKFAGIIKGKVFRCHGRTASYLTAPAQIPASGIPALGSSEILAFRKSKTNKI